MALTALDKTTVWDYCETDNWTGDATLGVDTDFYVEGSGSIAFDVDIETLRVFGASQTATNLSNTAIYAWLMVMTAPTLDTRAAGGMQICLRDNSGNESYWYVGGSDTYKGGWQCFSIHTGAAPDSNNGTNANLSSITNIGVGFKCTAKSKLADNCYVDYIRYGNDPMTVTGGTLGAPDDFDALVTADDAVVAGFIRKRGGSYFLVGPVQFGTTGNDNLFFEDKDQIVIFDDMKVSSTHYKISVVGSSAGTTSFQLGDSVGTGSNTLGSNPSIIKSIGKPWTLEVSDKDIDVFNLYSVTLSAGSAAVIGGAAVLGTACKIVDCTFNDMNYVELDVDDSSYAPLYLRNQVTFAKDSVKSIDIKDMANMDSSEWNIIQGPGFQSSSTGTAAIELKDYNFNNFTTPYITLEDNETWNVVNPSWTIDPTGTTELNFVGTSGNIVNEKYSLDLTVQQSDGTAIGTAQTYIYEGSTGQNLPSANRQSTDSSGVASSNILAREYTSSDVGGSLLVTAFGDFALKVYKYTYSPYVAAQTVNAGIVSTITLVPDSAITQTDWNTAYSNGSGIITWKETNPATLIEFGTGSGTLSIGSTVRGTTSKAEGVVVSFEEGDASDGKIFLKNRNASTFSNGETLINPEFTWSGVYTDNTERSYSWWVDCRNKSMAITYDYLAARMSSTSPTGTYINVLEWGEDEQSQLIYSGPEGYYTERNVNLNEGVFLANRGGGSIDYMTDDYGTTYTPPVTVTLTIGSVVSGDEPTAYVRCYIEAAAGGDLAEGDTLMNSYASVSDGGKYKATQQFSYTNPQPVTVKARYKGYLPFETSATITGDLTIKAIWQADPNYNP